MRTQLRKAVFVGLSLSLAGVATARGQDSAVKGEEPAVAFEDLKKAAGEYRITVETDPVRKPVLRPEPVLKWNNPQRATAVGVSFLWVADGRPEVIGCFYRHKEQGVQVEDHEFQSLADAGLTATLDGVEVWTPPTAGITFAPIPGAPAPAATAPERLRQLRALSREFRASFNGSEDKSELRLLTQPIYRYESTRPALQDGALFAFVQATDPEVVLAIEARVAGGKAVWHYGLARMSMVNLRAEHKGHEVWTADWDAQVSAPNKPYITRTVSKRLP